MCTLSVAIYNEGIKEGNILIYKYIFDKIYIEFSKIHLLLKEGCLNGHCIYCERMGV